MRAQDPDPGSLHTDAPLPGLSVGPTGLMATANAYYTHLIGHLKKLVHPDHFKAAHAQAAGHASGVARKHRAKKTATEDGHPDALDLFELLAYATDGEPEERLFVPLPAAFADAPAPPEWVPMLPRPGTYSHPRYGKVVMTAERIARFVEGIKKGTYQKAIPVDAEHDLKASGPLGYFSEARVNADGSADARVHEWTDRGLRMWRRFKYTSAEWWPSWPDPATDEVHADIVVGLALTSRPFFKDNASGTWLRGLVASESDQLTAFDAPASEEEASDPPQEETVPEPVVQTEQPVVAPVVAPVGMSDEVARQFTEMRTALEAATRQATEALTLAQAESTARTAAEARLAATESELALTRVSARRQRFNDLALGRGGESDGLAFAGPVETHVRLMEFIAVHDERGEESELLQGYVEMQRATAAVVAEGRVTGPGRGRVATPAANSAAARAEAMAAERMKANAQLTHEQALTEVFAADDALYLAVSDEQRAT